MPNANFPQGLQPHRHLSGAPWNGQLQMFAVLASNPSALFKGDVVKSAGTADANGIQAVIRSTANTDVNVGVIVGFTVNFANLNLPNQYLPASTAGYVLVCTDPTVVYEVQQSGNAALADIGLNVGLTFTAGSTVTGMSQMVANQSSVATTATLPLKIVGWVQRADVDVSDPANMKLEVLLNNTNMAAPNTVGV